MGLGNPGRRYEGTRHNVGFSVVETLAKRRGFSFRKPLLRPYHFFSFTGSTDAVVCVKPMTFMNRSGDVLGSLLRRWGVPPERCLTVVDNLDLPAGVLRLKRTGGESPHNGLRSIGTALSTFAFPRLYIGIGRPAAGNSVIDHVLSRFGAEEIDKVDAAVSRASFAVEMLGDSSLDMVLSWVNSA